MKMLALVILLGSVAFASDHVIQHEPTGDVAVDALLDSLTPSHLTEDAAEKSVAAFDALTAAEQRLFLHTLVSAAGPCNQGNYGPVCNVGAIGTLACWFNGYARCVNAGGGWGCCR